MTQLFFSLFILFYLVCNSFADPCASSYSSTNTATTCTNCTTGNLLLERTQSFCVSNTDSDGNCAPIQSDAVALYGAGSTVGQDTWTKTFPTETVVKVAKIITYCYNCQSYISSNCTACYSYLNFLSSVELQTISGYSLGCSECAPLNSMVLTYSASLGMYIRNCTSAPNLQQTCFIDSYYDSELGSCNYCKNKFPNCAACNLTSCIMCIENFYYSTNFLNSDGQAVAMCAPQICSLNYGPDQMNKTACLKCTIPLCRSCTFQINGIQNCLYCNKGYYLNPTATGCIAQTPATVLTYYVQPAPYTRGAVTQAMLQGVGSFASPFLFLYQALVQADRNSQTFRAVTTNIYLFPGTHFYFKCDSNAYTPNTADKTINMFDYCNALGASISNYYFKNDNNKVYIRALTCTQAQTLGLTNYNKKCSNFPNNPKPIIMVNSPTFYFNITNYYYFENLQFSGSNAFAYMPSNKSIRLQYFPTAFCNVSSTPLQKVGLMNFTSIEPSALTGFQYACYDPFYQGSTVPNNSNANYKCTSTNKIPSGIQSCTGEPMYQSYFQAYTAKNTTYGGGNYYEQRRKVLFNLYGFNDFSSQIDTPPTLVLFQCDFKFFLYNYDALIQVETYNMYINTFPTTVDQGTYIANPYSYYTYTGRDRGANIQITGSTFQYSRFCKGTIVYRKPISIADQNWIFNFTLQYSQVRSAAFGANQIVIVNSLFNQMNYATNQTSLTLFGANMLHPLVNLYSGVPNQPILQYAVMLHKGVIVNVEDFGGPVEFSGCTIQNNAIFIPEILMVNHSLAATYQASYFQNTLTNELEFSACNWDTKVNQYFLSTGYDKYYQMEFFTEQIERMSIIYISRNHGNMIFRSNIFTNNIGIFGGAISINSPNMAWSNAAYVIIFNCTFTNNMAYITGGAIFVRSAILETDLFTAVCAGVHILNSTFKQNLGLKKSNGGAVTLFCDLASQYDANKQDLASTSRILRSSLSQSFNYTEFISTVNIPGYSISGESYKVYKESTSIKNTVFQSNQAGLKGTAVYISFHSNVIVSNTTFLMNSPTYAFLEALVSPYYNMFSTQSLMYYDEKGICLNAFAFIQTCSQNNIYIDWPQVQGALAIEFCDIILCLNSSVAQGLLITNSVFNQNEAGPFLSTSQTIPMASSLYLSSGFNNNITNTQFLNSGSAFAQYVKNLSSTVYNFMPKNYFNYSQAPMIIMNVQPETSVVPIDFTTVVMNCTFLNNSHIQIQGSAGIGIYYGSLISYTSNALENTLINPKFNFTNSMVRDNSFLGESASMIYINDALISITKNNFINNGYISTAQNSSNFSIVSGTVQNFEFFEYQFQYIQQYGIFWLNLNFIFDYGQYHYIYLNTFSYCFSDYGTAFQVQSSYQSILLTKNTYTYMFANTGGAYFSGSSLQGQTTVMMTNENISYSYGGSFGSVYAANSQNTLNNQLVFYIQNCYFYNCRANIGSSIATQLISKIYVSNTNFTRQVFPNETTTVIRAYKVYLRPFSYYMSNNTVLSILINQIQEFGHLYLDNNYNDQQVIFGNQVLQSTSYANLAYNEFIQCTFNNLKGQFGAVIYALTTFVAMTNQASNTSQGIINNQGIVGMVYLYDQSVLIANNVMFKNNSATSDGSVIFSDHSYITLYNCIITGNSAPIGQGGIFAQGNSILFIDSTIFIGNSAFDSSAIYSNMNQLQTSSITNCLFQNNTSNLNLINLIYTNMTVSNTNFIDNISDSITNGFTMSSSTLTMINSVVTYINPAFLWENQYQVEVGFFYLIYKSTLNLTQGTNIQNCRGKTAASIYAASRSILYLNNNVIIQNCQSLYGSNIYISLAELSLIQNVIFQNNSQTDIYFERVNLTIDNCQFYNGGLQYLYGSFSNVTMSNVIMQNISNTGGTGGGIYCDCLYIIVSNCTFQNLSALYGGAMYLALDNPESYSEIFYSTFINNLAQFGGAIYIQVVNQLYVQNSTFNGNTAVVVANSLFSSSTQNLAMGGAIFFFCLPQVDILCQLILTQQNWFINNYASHEGGAIMYEQNKYRETGGATIFKNNSAEYGPNYASYPSKLNFNFISSNDNVTSAAPSQVRLLQSTTPFASGWAIVSGIGFSFQIQLFDQDNQLYSIDNTSLCQFSILGNSQATISNNQATANMGSYNFADVQILAPPGQNVSLEVQVFGLTNYGNTISFINIPISLTFSVRGCTIGETFTTENSCVLCPETTYLLYAPTNQTNCTPCSPYAYCYSGFDIAPQNGYWRSSNLSENFIQCPNFQACLAGNISNPIGVCATGYEEALCGNCQYGYSKPSAFQCAQCSSESSIVILIFIQLILAFVYTLFLTKSSLSGVSRVGPPLAIYLKVITSHYQILDIISMINFGWPQWFNSLLHGQSNLFNFASKILDLQCVVQYLNDGDNPKINPYYLSLIMIFLLPLALLLISILAWASVAFVTRKQELMKQKIICTFLVLFFLNYTSICKVLIAGIGCIKIDSQKMLMIDTTIQCFHGSHLSYFIGLIFPGIVCWVIGVPFFVLVVLFRNRSSIQRIDTEVLATRDHFNQIVALRTGYGFYFQGYKLNIYFWEIFIFYIKALIILFATTLQAKSEETQIIIIVFIIIVQLAIAIKVRPYNTNELNNLEQLSRIICAIILYCGLFFISSYDYSFMQQAAVQWIFFLIVLAANLSFILYSLYCIRLEVLKYVYPKSLLLFRIISCGIIKPNVFAEKYLTQPISRARLYKIEDEDLEDEIAKEGESPEKRGDQERGQFNEGFDKERKLQSDVDDMISRLQKGKEQKKVGEDNKTVSVIHPKDIIADLNYNKSSAESQSMYSDEESLKKSDETDKKKKKKRHGEAKIVPIDDGPGNYISSETQSNSKMQGQFSKQDLHAAPNQEQIQEQQQQQQQEEDEAIVVKNARPDMRAENYKISQNRGGGTDLDVQRNAAQLSKKVPVKNKTEDVKVEDISVEVPQEAKTGKNQDDIDDVELSKIIKAGQSNKKEKKKGKSKEFFYL